MDLTGKRQHGLKKNKSTATAGALLQSIIARAADSVIMSFTNDDQHEGHEPMSHKTVLVLLVFTSILQL